MRNVRRWEDLNEKQKEHLRRVFDNVMNNDKECLHDQCQECFGTGVKIDGTPCVHNISCNCSKCGTMCLMTAGVLHVTTKL